MSQVDTYNETTTLPAGLWTVDPAHSSIEFGIKHLLITTVKGAFNDFDGTVGIGADGSIAATGTIRAGSIDTNQPQRDEHLRSPDFFDAAQFPEIHFQSTRVDHLEGNRFRVTGNLTIKGVTRELELDAELAGGALDAYGNERIGLLLTGQLDPTDYGVDWNQELETGGNLLGDRVDFTANVSAVKAA